MTLHVYCMYVYSKNIIILGHLLDWKLIKDIER